MVKVGDKVPHATLRMIGAEGPKPITTEELFPKGKKVVAWGSSFDQRQYYIAAHADEVYLHPLGAVNVTGLVTKELAPRS